jgi:uncharacterized membrane protein YdjX (TVP38/TMEM64 family)
MSVHALDDTEPATPTCLSRAARAVLPAILILVLCIGFALSPTLFAKVVSCKQWFIEGGLQGVLYFTMMFSASMATLLPYTPFCIATGYIWGFSRGLVVQFLAVFVSSGFIYGIGRALVVLSPTTAVSSWTWHQEWMNLIPEIDRDWRNAAKLNFLLCYIPMPYGVHAYIFALSKHAFVTFVAVFEVGMIGHMILNLKIGSLLASRDDTNAHNLKIWGVVISVCVMVVVTLVSAWFAQRQLDLDRGAVSVEKDDDNLAVLEADHITGHSLTANENVRLLDPTANENVRLLDPTAKIPPDDGVVRHQ